MIEIQQSKQENILEVKIISEATDADLEKVIPVLEKHIAEVPNPRLLLMLEDITDWSDVLTLWGDLNLDGDDVNDFERIAIIGDASWKGWLTTSIEKLVKVDLKFFGRPEAEHARKWVQN
jgi:hypothetical protein